MGSTKLLVVGAGVMGSVIGAWASRHGYQVTLFDDRRPGAGSVASAGMIIESWSPLLAHEHIRALHVLDELYGLESVRFDPKRVGLFVPPRKFLKAPEGVTVREERVIKVGGGWLYTEDSFYTGRVVLATGCWAKELWWKADAVRALAGTAFMWDGALGTPVLREWAPYKQIMAFNRDPDRVWTGDGTSILRQNYGPSRESSSRQRCAEAVGRDPALVSAVTGYRPYIQGQKRGVCEKIMNKTWLVTGGGKSSTILSAHYAADLIKEMR